MVKKNEKKNEQKNEQNEQNGTPLPLLLLLPRESPLSSVPGPLSPH